MSTPSSRVNVCSRQQAITALSECNGNVRIFLKRGTYVISILGIAQIPSFTLTWGYNPLVKEIYEHKMVCNHRICEYMLPESENEAESAMFSVFQKRK